MTAAAFTKQLDSVIDKLQDLYSDALDAGHDEQAATLERILDELREVTFTEPEPEEVEEVEQD